MENIDLPYRGLCAHCGKRIGADWQDHPLRGCDCRSCGTQQPRLMVFGPNHIDFPPASQVKVGDKYVWGGARVSISGKLGTIEHTTGSGASVKFDDGTSESFYGIGHWDLVRIYEAKGGD
jgi:hypothetical protein